MEYWASVEEIWEDMKAERKRAWLFSILQQRITHRSVCPCGYTNLYGTLQPGGSYPS